MRTYDAEVLRLIIFQSRYEMREGEYRVNGLGVWLYRWADRLGVAPNYNFCRGRWWWWRETFTLWRREPWDC
jgi:hypothetical protein